MGTTKPGRVINSVGSAGVASQYVIIHSNEGTYVGLSVGRIRLKSGGHGQAGMNELNRYGIEYHVIKTYSNGVRVGNIPRHKNKMKASGTGQAWFPKEWTSRDIKHAGEHVSRLKSNRKCKDGVPMFGMWKGVRVGVIRDHGKIATIFPDVNQPKKKRSKRNEHKKNT